jgi:hypothetical protein
MLNGLTFKDSALYYLTFRDLPLNDSTLMPVSFPPCPHRLHAAATNSLAAQRQEGVRAAFTAAKQALLSATHLDHPTVGAALWLVVDASAMHVGARLQQQLPGRKDWQPLGLFSKKLGAA